MEVDGNAVNTSMTIQQMTDTVMKAIDNETSTTRTVTITQDWSIIYEGDLDKLLEQCQRRFRTCELATSRRRSLLSGSTSAACGAGGGSGAAVFTRSLSDGNLTDEVAEIPQLEASNVSVSSTTLCKVDMKLSLTQQGGVEEASSLLNG